MHFLHFFLSLSLRSARSSVSFRVLGSWKGNSGVAERDGLTELATARQSVTDSPWQSYPSFQERGVVRAVDSELESERDDARLAKWQNKAARVTSRSFTWPAWSCRRCGRTRWTSPWTRCPRGCWTRHGRAWTSTRRRITCTRMATW